MGQLEPAPAEQPCSSAQLFDPEQGHAPLAHESSPQSPFVQAHASPQQQAFTFSAAAVEVSPIERSAALENATSAITAKTVDKRAIRVPKRDMAFSSIDC
jgi:hypothetical protein